MALPPHSPRPRPTAAGGPRRVAAARPRRPVAARPRGAGPPARPRTPALLRRAAAGLLVAVLALGLLGAARHLRPAPYGDRLLNRAQGEPGPGEWAARAHAGAVAGFDSRTGALRWRYARAGHRPLAVLPARGEVIALWDDGLLTDTDGRSVRWHRALPDAAEWLPAQGGTGVLRPLGRGILAVVTPRRVTAYRTADGDLRWVLPARTGCAFRPESALWRGTALLLAQPCADSAWTGQLVALDDLGRIAPGRTPLGNDLPSSRPGRRPRRPDAGKALARPR